MPLAAAPDGASQVDGDTEEGEEFDFDSDDSGADTSHQAAETSHVVDRKQPGSDVQETTAADVSGATGSRASGKHSLYHRCSYQAGRERCITLTEEAPVHCCCCNFDAFCLFLFFQGRRSGSRQRGEFA